MGYINIHIDSIVNSDDIYIYIPKIYWSLDGISELIKQAIDTTFEEDASPTELDS